MKAALLKKQIQMQKDLMTKLESQKDTLSAEEKADIKAKIKSLQAQPVAEDKPVIRAVVPVSDERRRQAEKEVLDRELELLKQPKPTTVVKLESDAKDGANPIFKEALKKVETEAATRGLVDSKGNIVSPAGRGRGRGGRVWIRGQTEVPSPVSPATQLSERPGGRGRGFAVPRMSLDNRPSTLRVDLTGVAADTASESALRAHFQAFGEISSLSVNTSQALIKFSSRRAAETALAQGAAYGHVVLKLGFAGQDRKKDEDMHPSESEVEAPSVVSPPTKLARQRGGDSDEDEEEEDKDSSWKR